MFSSPFIVPLVAIIGGLSVGALSMWFKHREKLASHGEGDAAVLAEITALKQRVAALETIVTDDREQLRRKIDSL